MTAPTIQVRIVGYYNNNKNCCCHCLTNLLLDCMDVSQRSFSAAAAPISKQPGTFSRVLPHGFCRSVLFMGAYKLPFALGTVSVPLPLLTMRPYSCGLFLGCQLFGAGFLFPLSRVQPPDGGLFYFRYTHYITLIYTIQVTIWLQYTVNIVIVSDVRLWKLVIYKNNGYKTVTKSGYTVKVVWWNLLWNILSNNVFMRFVGFCIRQNVNKRLYNAVCGI